LLGPVGGGRSSIAERLKQLAERVPFYAIKGSPVNESPLGLFDYDEDGPILEEQYGIPRRYLKSILSPWAVKRLHEFNGDIRKFRIVRRYPSILRQIGIAKTEPGDDNNQDISSLVGKVDIRKLEQYAQDDADAYSYSGGLCLANQGLLDFVEMFKAPIKVLHPLLTATQEGNFKGTESFGAIPFDGVILTHSNQSEWKTFRNNRDNAVLLQSIFLVRMPKRLRVPLHFKDKCIDRKRVRPTRETALRARSRRLFRAALKIATEQAIKRVITLLLAGVFVHWAGREPPPTPPSQAAPHGITVKV